MRYDKKTKFLNDLIEYQPLFEKREIKSIIHYQMGGLKYPSESDMYRLTVREEVWKRGDAFWKYASKYYDNQPELWWVIAFFNNAPTDAHMIIGDTVYIPTPLQTVLSIYGV